MILKKFNSDFGGGALVSPSTTSVLLLHLTENGTFINSLELLESGFTNNSFSIVVVGSNGNVFFTFKTASGNIFIGSYTSTSLTTLFNSSSTGGDPSDLATNLNGNFVITGSYSGNFSLQGQSFESNTTNIFVASFVIFLIKRKNYH